MRKNNHETLTDHLKKMVSMFNQHYMELEKRLDFIQLLFTETQYVQGRPLWNKASIYLPVSLAGQLMIFETIFGVLFVYILNQQLPSLMEFSGITLLLGTVIYGIRTLSPQPSLA